MVIRKHISLEKKEVDKIEPFLVKHNGNFSAAMRDIINKVLDQKIALTHSNEIMIFDSSIANLLLAKACGIIPEKEILHELADPSLFYSVSKTLDYFNIKFKELGWDVELNIRCDSDTNPTTAVLTIKNRNYQLLDLSARILSLFLSVEKRLGIEKVYRRSSSIELMYKLRGCEEIALSDLKQHLGTMQDLCHEIEKHPNFWQKIAKKYRDNNYKIVAVHKNTFEELLANETPVGEIGIELIAKRPIKDIPHREFLNILKEVHETSRIVENIDIEGDTVNVYHSYRNPKAIETVKNLFLNQFKANGQTYTATSTRNLIIFRHIPKMGIKTAEIIENLKKSGSNFDNQLIEVITFISTLRYVTKTTKSLHSYGYTMGKQVFKVYEKEHDIDRWDLKTFKEVFTLADSKIKRLSEWKSLDKNSGCYTIKECSLVQIGGEFNINVCQLMRGFFRGAIEYAFNNHAEMKVTKQVTHDDDMCEVCIHTNPLIRITRSN
ncbi:MAG: hypothetical protein AEth_00434 [Candidatus Argoarchaeum ethanivorans]|uniref:Uncharacterized protein n=1 Tax=Candidatus Argoarchaeum ethanivorans TaxID=2608793 RepID=A0A8B3S6V6_9EURY|nr:MAG: hypothetical protein AEth_00434 [Candidatus Argoarchaeum ethanivorans]